jgi:hypothetical protein
VDDDGFGSVFFSHKKAAKKSCALAAILLLEVDIGDTMTGMFQGDYTQAFTSSRFKAKKALETSSANSDDSRNEEIIDPDNCEKGSSPSFSAHITNAGRAILIYQIGRSACAKWCFYG